MFVCVSIGVLVCESETKGHSAAVLSTRARPALAWQIFKELSVTASGIVRSPEPRTEGGA